jgi:hypothetical protein
MADMRITDFKGYFAKKLAKEHFKLKKIEEKEEISAKLTTALADINPIIIKEIIALDKIEQDPRMSRFVNRKKNIVLGQLAKKHELLEKELELNISEIKELKEK